MRQSIDKTSQSIKGVLDRAYNKKDNEKLINIIEVKNTPIIRNKLNNYYDLLELEDELEEEILKNYKQSDLLKNISNTLYIDYKGKKI